MFVGEARARVVERLVADWHAVCAGGGPRIVFISAPMGWGKTRVVQEFYSRLASEPPGQSYWPQSIVERTTSEGLQELHLERKRLAPIGSFSVGTNERPPFVWLALQTDPSDYARPEEAYRSLFEQLKPHLFPILRRMNLSKATVKAVRKIVFSFAPIPADIDAFLEIGSAASDLASEWAQGRTAGRTMNDATPGSASSAELWKLFTTVWGRKRAEAPPLVIVIEDCHFISEPTVELLCALMASDIPVLVIASGWPLSPDPEPRMKPFTAMALSRPPRFREERLQTLSERELRELVSERHPGTSRSVLEALTTRTGGNPYAVRLMLVQLGAREGVAVVTDLEHLQTREFDIHHQLGRLFSSQRAESRHSIAACALLGFRMPVAVAMQVAAAAQGNFQNALDSGWMALVAQNSDLVAFTEPIRHEVAASAAADEWSLGRRKEIMGAGLLTVRRMVGAEPMGSASTLLGEIQLHLAIEGVERDLGAAARSAILLMKSLRYQLARIALQVVIELAWKITGLGVLLPEVLAELAVERAAATLFCYRRSSPETVAAVNDALEMTSALISERPDLRVTTLLKSASMHRDVDSPTLFDIDRSRAEMNKAWQLIDANDLASEPLLHLAAVGKYALASVEGDRKRAMDLALAESSRCQSTSGPTLASLTSMSDAAWYASRHDPQLGVELSRRVVAQKIAFWGDAAHPRVAIAKQELAVRLLRLRDDTVLTEAWQLSTEAHQALDEAFGPDDNATLNSMAARSRCSRYMAASLRRTGDHEAAGPLATLSLDLATAVLEARQRRWPGEARFSGRQDYGAALAATGDRHGIIQLRSCLDELLATRPLSSPTSAEVRWLAEDLHDALASGGETTEARVVFERYLT